MLGVYSLGALVAVLVQNRRIQQGRVQQLQKVLTLYRASVNDSQTWEATTRMARALGLELELARFVDGGFQILDKRLTTRAATGYRGRPILVEHEGAPIGFLLNPTSLWGEPTGKVQLWSWEYLLWWMLLDEHWLFKINADYLDFLSTKPIWEAARQGVGPSSSVISEPTAVLIALDFADWPEDPRRPRFHPWREEPLPRQLHDLDLDRAPISPRAMLNP